MDAKRPVPPPASKQHTRENTAMADLDIYEKAFASIVDSTMRGSLLDIPQHKLYEAPSFDHRRREASLTFTPEALHIPAIQKTYDHKNSFLKHQKERHMICKYNMSEWVNNLLLLTYNPILHYYDSRLRSARAARHVGLRSKTPSRDDYKREVKNVGTVQSFMSTTPDYNMFEPTTLSEMLGLPQSKQSPEERNQALKRALTTEEHRSLHRHKSRPRCGPPVVNLEECQKGLMTASMLEKAMLLRKQPKDVSGIADVAKHLRDVLDIPIRPTPTFRKFLNSYKPRRQMVSKFNNKPVFFDEYEPTIVTKQQMAALIYKQKREMNRYLNTEKNAGTDYRPPERYKNLVLKL